MALIYGLKHDRLDDRLMAMSRPFDVFALSFPPGPRTFLWVFDQVIVADMNEAAGWSHVRVTFCYWDKMLGLKATKGRKALFQLMIPEG